VAAKLILDIITDTSKAVTGLKQLSGATDKAAASSEKTNTKWKTMAGTAAKVAGAAALGGVVAVFKTGVQEQSDFLAGQAQLEAGLKSTHNAAHTSVKSMEDLASSVQDYSGQTDDSIVASEKLLLTFTNVRNEAGKNNDIFNQATKITADMAARMGGDASKYAVQLGKALNDPVKGLTSLTRIGVSFNAGQQKTIKNLAATGHTMEAQKIIMAELRKEFGGSAEAAGKTLPGQMARAKRSFEDLSQSLVSTFMPVLATGAKALSAIMKFMSPGLVIAFAAAIGVLAVAFKVWQFWTVTLTAANRAFAASLLTNPIFLVIAALVVLGTALFIAYKKSATFRKIVQAAFRGVAAAGRFIADAFMAVVHFLQRWWPLVLAVLLPFIGIPLLIWKNFRKIKDFVRKAFDAVVSFIKKLPARFLAAGKKLWDWILDYYKLQWRLVVAAVTASIAFVKKIPGWFASAGKKIWDWIVALWKVQWAIVKTLVSAAVDFVKKIPGKFATAAKAVWSWLVDKFKAAWDNVKTAVGNAVDWIGRLPAKFASSAKAVWGWLVDKFKTAWTNVKTAVTGAVSWIGGLGGKLKKAAGALWGWLGDKLDSAWSSVKTKFGDIVSFVAGLPGKIARNAKGMWDGITGAFKSAMNAIIRGWNSLQFKIPGFTIPIPFAPDFHFGGFTLGVPDIPLLATGGYVNRATLAVVGDRGGEFVAPEPMLRQLIRDELGGAGIHITVNGALDPDAVARQLESILARRHARIAGPVRRGATTIGVVA